MPAHWLIPLGFSFHPGNGSDETAIFAMPAWRIIRLSYRNSRVKSGYPPVGQHTATHPLPRDAAIAVMSLKSVQSVYKSSSLEKFPQGGIGTQIAQIFTDGFLE